MRQDVAQHKLKNILIPLRRMFESGFAPDTAATGYYQQNVPSAGHCSPVAAIIYEMFGGQLMRAQVQHCIHWFNRLPIGHDQFDVDLTGDQFGFEPVQVEPAGELYEDATPIRFSTVSELFTPKAVLLAKRSGLYIPGCSRP